MNGLSGESFIQFISQLLKSVLLVWDGTKTAYHHNCSNDDNNI